MHVAFLRALVVVVLFLIWQILAYLSIIPHHKIPSPWETLLGVKTLTLVGLPSGYKLFTHIVESLYRVLYGFSIAIGAFVAGVALANLPYTFEIIGRVKSLRDFFAIP